MTTKATWLTWASGAACQGKDLVLFFGPDGERQPEREQRERKAKRVCRRCPVLDDCERWALGVDASGRVVARGEKHGVWAGLSEDERANRRRQIMRRSQAKAS